MIKRCPTCNRTYTDESINFCLADGAFLTAPDDPLPTVASPAPRITESPTEILSTEQLPVNINTAPSATKSVQEKTARKQSLLPWLIAGILAIAFILYLAIQKSSTPNNSNNLSASSDNQTANTDESVSSSPQSSSNQGVIESNKRSDAPSNISINANGSETKRSEPSQQSGSADNTRMDSGGLGPGRGEPQQSNNAGNTKETTTEDYNRIFNPSEVTVKARILSRLEPQYTEEARKNQVSGTVVLRAVFSASGQVTDIKVVSGLPYGLNERSIAVARMIKFVPAMKNGHPISTYIQIEYNFNLY
ncbi:MAG: hypothetical protein DMF68_02975 [Acidobacteria bacterium]|nr:MAG: hypothetical protein DMF68_02975 [Acidobacteriota bacterium]